MRVDQGSEDVIGVNIGDCKPRRRNPFTAPALPKESKFTAARVSATMKAKKTEMIGHVVRGPPRQ